MVTTETHDSTSASTPDRRWLVYGANGYTGHLIAAEAVRRGMSPVLAGRNETELRKLAELLDCEYRVFSLDEPDRAREALSDIDVVLHCAGPFVRTSAAMIDTCLASHTHYMDITGEIPVLEEIFARHDEFLAAGITVLPGAGYDVVPTDCLAMMLKEQLPDATRLTLAFCGKIYQSPGTWKATLDSLPRCGRVRKNGVLVQVPHVWKMQRLRFDHAVCNTICIPWGDVASAWRSTGIPDIEVYGGVPLLSAYFMRAVRGLVCSVMKIDSVMNFSKRMVSRFVRGPNKRQRSEGRYHLRGDVWNDRGDHRSMLMETPEGYTCTVEAALGILPHVLAGTLPTGALTPSQAMGSGFTLKLKGISIKGEVGSATPAR